MLEISKGSMDLLELTGSEYEDCAMEWRQVQLKEGRRFCELLVVFHAFHNSFEY